MSKIGPLLTRLTCDGLLRQTLTQDPVNRLPRARIWRWASLRLSRPRTSPEVRPAGVRELWVFKEQGFLGNWMSAEYFDLTVRRRKPVSNRE
jgi:hypothetical protein